MRYTHTHVYYYFISILQPFYNHQILTVLIKIPKAETKSLARRVGAASYRHHVVSGDQQPSAKPLFETGISQDPCLIIGRLSGPLYSGYRVLGKSDIAHSDQASLLFSLSGHANAGSPSERSGDHTACGELVFVQCAALPDFQWANLDQPGFWTKCSLFIVAEAFVIPEQLPVPEE